MVIKIEMVEIPASQDQEIGSFRIGIYPVTQAQYEAVMGANPSHPQNPVQVSYDDAEVFCIKLNGITGKTYRLPTEAEWEYACRAGTTTNYYFGDDASQLEDYAWYYSNSGGTTHPVGQKKPNAWGLFDMNGNVWEWCEEGCIRGGSWGSLPYNCRSAIYKNVKCLDNRYDSFGFRVVETIKPVLLAEEMWEAGLPEPHQDMTLNRLLEYLETLQTKEEKKKLLTAIYWSGFQACLDYEDD